MTIPPLAHFLAGYFFGLLIGAGLAITVAKHYFEKFIEDLPTREELRELFELDKE